MSSSGNNIVFIVVKHSVIIKGIERKLADKGYNVSEITDDFVKLYKLSLEADLFVLYIPENVFDDNLKQIKLSEICERIKMHGLNVIVIGEERSEEEITSQYPVLLEHLWINRPIDFDKFCAAVEETINDSESAKKKAENAGKEKKNILIVDDDHSYAGMVRIWIKDTYRANIVTDGMKAITYLLRNPVDLILLDYEMPIVDCPQVLQMLRQESVTANIPVVFLTGVSTKEEVGKVMQLKPAGYILKSATKEALLAYLEKKI